jgi:2'-5' RNA ligase
MKYFLIAFFIGLYSSVFAGEQNATVKMQNFSVWLIPAQKDFDYFGNVINKMARKQGVPAFRPHVTLFVGQTDSLKKIEQILKNSTNLPRPFSLKTNGLDVTEAKFKTLFITLNNNEQLATLSLEIGKIALKNEYHFKPHLSLLYKDMPLNEKEALLKKIDLKATTITFDKIELIREDDPDIVSEWIPVFTQELGKNHH